MIIKSDSQKILEILDGLCVQNTNDFSNIDRMARVMSFTKVPSSIQDADSAFHENGGSSYYGQSEGINL